MTEYDIKEVLDYRPEVLIIGTGANGLMKVDNDLKDKLISFGIDLIIKKTSEAVTEYNRVYKDKKVVCALHLTC
ncbi:MAG: MTH938/NDUFAF3 family protein [Actinobacteria bacterium]|nr:MTH938/NDUFAF3 family protein [Actinomycetota bacterium]